MKDEFGAVAPSLSDTLSLTHTHTHTHTQTHTHTHRTYGHNHFTRPNIKTTYYSLSSSIKHLAPQILDLFP